MNEPRWDPKKPVAPFDKDGNLMHYPESWRTPTWQDAPPFRASLKLADMARGRSAAYFMWEAYGKTYPMFMKDLTEVIQTLDISGGTTEYRQWKIVKRGQNYGLALDC